MYRASNVVERGTRPDVHLRMFDQSRYVIYLYQSVMEWILAFALLGPPRYDSGQEDNGSAFKIVLCTHDRLLTTGSTLCIRFNVLVR